MNQLPFERRLINGRTYSTSWNPSSMDPISHYRHPINWASRLVAAVIGLGALLGILKWSIT